MYGYLIFLICIRVIIYVKILSTLKNSLGVVRLRVGVVGNCYVDFSMSQLLA